MTTVYSGVGRGGHGGADCAVPKLRAGKGRGKGASKGGRSGEGNASSRGSSCGDTSSSTESKDESSPETSAARCTPQGTRRLKQDDSDWSAFNDDVSELSD
jgi:hypothetical protein